MSEIEIGDIVKFLKKIGDEEPQEYITSEEYKKKEAEVFKEFEEKGEICFADKAQVCMIVLKTKRLVNLALSMLGCTLELSPKPNLDYKIGDISENKSRFSGEYLKIVLELCKKGNPILNVRYDYPLKVELDEIGLEFILAPRISD